MKNVFCKKIIKTLMFIILVFILSSCNGNNNVNPTKDTITSEDDAKAIIRAIVPNVAVFYGSVFNGGGYFKVDKSVTIPDENNYALVADDKIKTIADLKAWVEETFTKEVAETCFYNVYLKDIDLPISSFDRNEYTPLYYEYNGQLYVDTSNGGRGFAFDWLYDTTKIILNEKDTITASIDRTLFNEFDETSTISLVKINEHWLVSNDFINHLHILS